MWDTYTAITLQVKTSSNFSLLSLHFSKEILSQWIKINVGSIWYYSPEKDHKLDYSHFGIMKKECEKQAAEVSYKSHSLPLASRFDLRRIFI